MSEITIFTNSKNAAAGALPQQTAVSIPSTMKQKAHMLKRGRNASQKQKNSPDM